MKTNPNKWEQQAIDTAPQGTWGLVVTPWAAPRVCGVAADWGQASRYVWHYTAGGWRLTDKQVADFRHSKRAALAAEVREAIRRAGGDQQAESIDEIVDRAWEFQ